MEKKQASTRITTLMLVTACSLGMASAQEGALSDRPATGIDADLRIPLVEAEKNLQASHPAESVAAILLLYTEDNRFAVAQRSLLAADSLRILKTAAERLDSLGQTKEATQALDAAWQIGGKTPWPEFSRRLFSMAKDMRKIGSGAEALYLTRRATEVDPANREALVLDQRLSVNPYQTSGTALKITGGIIAGVGIAAIVIPASYGLTNGLLDDPSNLPSGVKYALIGGLVSAAIGSGIALTGALLVRVGRPVEKPSSPEFLPAL